VRDYRAVCPEGHESYVNLRLSGIRDVEEVEVRCPTCGQPARATPLLPPVQRTLEEVRRKVHDVIEPHLVGMPWPDDRLKVMAEFFAAEHGCTLEEYQLIDGVLHMRLVPKQEFIVVTIPISEGQT
jgi:hypothetical protein